MNHMHLTAQRPLPQIEGNEALTQRLQRANHASLRRSLENTEQLSTKIKAHLHISKDERWTDKMIEYLDHARLELLDFTQAQFAAGMLSLDEQNAQSQSINTQMAQARQALTSPASPLAGALGFAQNHKGLVGYMDQLTEQVHAHLQTDQPTQNVELAPTQS